MGPQCEDGYTKIANELLEALCRTRISGESMQIFWVILRKTYGYKKKIDRISLSQFTAMTGMKKPAVVRALRNLHGMSFIIKVDNGKTASYGINKQYEEWEPLSKRATTFNPLSKLKKFCYICNFEKAIEKHHIVPRSEGGSNKSENLIMLCPNCHTLVHRKDFSRDALIIKKANVESVINDDNVLLTDPVENDEKPLSKTVPTKEKLPTKEKKEKEDFEKRRLEGFHMLYQDYPRKIGKEAALRHYNASVKTLKDMVQIDLALAEYLKAVIGCEMKFIKHASAWFNQWKSYVPDDWEPAYLEAKTAWEAEHEDNECEKDGPGADD